MQIALAVASERGVTLDRACRHGRVLYIAVEETPRRMQDRHRKMLGLDDHLKDVPWPDRLHLHYDWPDWAHGGLDHLDEFVAAYPDTVLVLIDTTGRFRGPTRGGGGYDADYDYSHALSEWTNKHDLSLLGITHTAKRRGTDSPDDDPLDLVQNTTGITAGADTVLVMRRNQGVMTLYRRGRDLDDDTPLRLRGDTGTLRWDIGEDGDQPVSARDAVLTILREADKPLMPRKIADLTGCDQNNVRQALFRMLTRERPVLVGVEPTLGYYLLGGKADPKGGGQ